MAIKKPSDLSLWWKKKSFRKWKKISMRGKRIFFSQTGKTTLIRRVGFRDWRPRHNGGPIEGPL